MIDLGLRYHYLPRDDSLHMERLEMPLLSIVNTVLRTKKSIYSLFTIEVSRRSNRDMRRKVSKLQVYGKDIDSSFFMSLEHQNP